MFWSQACIDEFDDDPRDDSQYEELKSVWNQTAAHTGDAGSAPTPVYVYFTAFWMCYMLYLYI